jgi:hypothetical protein
MSHIIWSIYLFFDMKEKVWKRISLILIDFSTKIKFKDNLNSTIAFIKYNHGSSTNSWLTKPPNFK